jgi:hypothetical protein
MFHREREGIGPTSAHQRSLYLLKVLGFYTAKFPYKFINSTGSVTSRGEFGRS